MTSRYCFCVTIKTSDEAVLHCMRGLSHYAQRTGKKMTAWGGTTKVEWIRDGHCVTFRFSNPQFRNKFIEEASRLFPTGLWEKISENDE